MSRRASAKRRKYPSSTSVVLPAPITEADAILLSWAHDRERVKKRFENAIHSKPDFGYWAKFDTWKHNEAVALLLGYDPRQVTEDLVRTYDGESPAARKYRRLSALLHASGCYELHGRIAPSDALAWASRKGFKVLPKLVTLVEKEMSNTGEAESAQRQQTSARRLTVVQSNSKTRSNALAAVIRLAQKKSSDPDDYQAVFAQLRNMADSKERPAPLVGYVQGEGVKYEDGDRINFLTKAALRMRFGRKRPK
jgi:hypothetical protein